jgi:hypothetical protein
MFCSIATGTLWLGTPVSCTAGPVIYWGAEDPYAIPDRIKAWGVHNGIDVPRDRLLVVRRPAGRKLTLADLSWLDALTRGAVRLGASALAVDTVSVAGGLEEENANAEVGELMARCHTLAHETGMHITVLAHTPSTGALRPRGATAFYDNARQVLGIVADGKGRRISMTKNNNGPKPRPKSVRIEGVPGIRQIKGEEPQSVGVMVIDASEEAGRAEDDEIVLEVLRSLGGEVCHVPVLKLHAAIPPELEWSRAKVYTWCKRMVPRGRLEWVKKRGLRLQATNLVGDLLD